MGLGSLWHWWMQRMRFFSKYLPEVKTPLLMTSR